MQIIIILALVLFVAGLLVQEVASLNSQELAGVLELLNLENALDVSSIWM